MRWRNSVESWGAVQKALHWTTALFVVGLVAVGWIMVEREPGRRTFELYALHKSTGLALLALVLVRLAWRVTQPRPALPAAMPRWERRLAGVVHGSIYAVLVAMPLSGWVLHSASGLPLRWFGLARVPAIAPRGDDLKLLAADVHYALAWLLALLVALHLAGVLKHRFIDRDDVLRGMLPRRRVRVPAPADEETR